MADEIIVRVTSKGITVANISMLNSLLPEKYRSRINEKGEVYLTAKLEPAIEAYSDEQLRFFWGAVAPALLFALNQAGYEVKNKQDAVDIFKMWLGYKVDVVNPHTGEVIYSKPKSISRTKAGKQELHDFTESCIKSLRDNFQIEIEDFIDDVKIVI